MHRKRSYLVSRNKVCSFGEHWNKKHDAELLIYQSKANLVEKILFSEITHFLDPDFRKKCWEGACFGTRIPYSILFHNLLAIEN